MNSKLFLVAALITIAIAIEPENGETNPIVPGGQIEKNSTTPEPPTTQKPENTTTSIPETTTTSKPENTTTSKPETTTPEPTTSEPVPTTVEPTTTPEPETTTSEPQPEIPKSPVNNYVEIRDPKANNSLCLKAKFDLTFSVHYNDTQGDTKESEVYLPKFSNPFLVKSDGCSLRDRLEVTFKWKWNDKHWNASMVFKANNKTYNLTGVEAHFYNDPEVFPQFWSNTTEYLTYKNLTIHGLPGHIGHAYRCMSEENVIVVPPNKLVLKVSQLEIQAFNFTTKNDDFSKDVDVCLQDEPESKLVPIIVGCVLAGLIVLVLVAYVVASRRYKKYRGYETL